MEGTSWSQGLSVTADDRVVPLGAIEAVLISTGRSQSGRWLIGSACSLQVEQRCFRHLGCA